FRRGGTSLIGGLDVGDGRFDDRERVGANAGRREGGRGRDPQVVKSHVRCSSGSAGGGSDHRRGHPRFWRGSSQVPRSDEGREMCSPARLRFPAGGSPVPQPTSALAESDPEIPINLSEVKITCSFVAEVTARSKRCGTSF